MYSWWLPLLLFLVKDVKSGAVDFTFPDSLYPSDLYRNEFRSKCPFQYDKISFCSSKFEDCIAQQNSLNYCSRGFCSCLENEEGSSEPRGEMECQEHSRNACFLLDRHRKSFEEQIIHKKKDPHLKWIKNQMKSMDMRLNSAAEACMIKEKLDREADLLMERLNSSNEFVDMFAKYLALPAVESSMAKNLSRCQSAIRKFERSLETVDSNLVRDIHLPYEFSQIGVEFGAPMKVAMRLISNEVCEKATLNINHQTVIWLNCYDQQKRKEECDVNYIHGIKKILKTMDSKKVACGMLIEFIETILPIQSTQFYEEAAIYHVDGTMMTLGGKLDRGFVGFVNDSITGRDSKNTILRLDASEKTSRRIVDNYEQVLAKCGATRRSAGVVSSCGYLYAYCSEFVQSRCSIQLSVCLDNIENMDDGCKNAINVSKTVFWDVPTTPRITTATSQMTTLMTIKYDFSSTGVSWSFWLKCVVVVVAVTGTLALLVFVARYFCKNHKWEKSSEFSNLSMSSNISKSVEGEKLMGTSDGTEYPTITSGPPVPETNTVEVRTGNNEEDINQNPDTIKEDVLCNNDPYTDC